MSERARFERVAFSPGEFATLFGKSQTWGYRQIYAGKVKAITEHGRTLIPASEVDFILKKAGIYDGAKSKPKKTKAGMLKLAPAMQNAWKGFLAARRQSTAAVQTPLPTLKAKPKWPAPTSGRQAAMERLSGKRAGKKSRD